MSVNRHDDRAIIRELHGVAEGLNEHELLQFRSIVTAHQYRRVYREFRSHVPAGTCVLDWGPGNGHFSFFLQRAGYRVTGYSFEPFVYEKRLPSADYRFVAGSPADPVRLPLDDASFDAVASIGVLEHVRETGGTEEGSLAEITRVLKPGGHFVCCHFPNQHSWIDRAARMSPDKYVHEWRYTKADVVSLVGGAGLELLKVWRYGCLPRNFWYKVPKSLRSSEALAAGWDLLDDALALPLGRFAQNYAFVARKPASPSSNA